jgi:hypothetical protein
MGKTWKDKKRKGFNVKGNRKWNERQAQEKKKKKKVVVLEDEEI